MAARQRLDVSLSLSLADDDDDSSDDCARCPAAGDLDLCATILPILDP